MKPRRLHSATIFSIVTTSPPAAPAEAAPAEAELAPGGAAGGSPSPGPGLVEDDSRIAAGDGSAGFPAQARRALSRGA